MTRIRAVSTGDMVSLPAAGIVNSLGPKRQNQGVLSVPIVRIDIQSGKSTAYKRAILHGVRSALTTALGVPNERVMQRIVETPSEDIDVADVRTDRLTIIEISMLTGRGPELKGELYLAIADRLLSDPGITRHDLVVLVNEGAGECFFLNGQMSCAPVDPKPTEEDKQ